MHRVLSVYECVCVYLPIHWLYQSIGHTMRAVFDDGLSWLSLLFFVVCFVFSDGGSLCGVSLILSVCNVCIYKYIYVYI